MYRCTWLCWTVLALIVLLCGCRSGPTPTPLPPSPSGQPPVGATNFRLTCTSFTEGGTIPARHAGKGDNLSPPLSWEGVPGGTQELALIVEDGDAPGGDFVHWIIYGIPAGMVGLEEGLPTEGRPAEGAGLRQGRNDAGGTGYYGPAPPPGKLHHYRFRLLALNEILNLPAKPNKKAFRRAVEGHIIGEATLTGTFAGQ